MERRRIKRVPVIDQGRLVGIVSRANLVRAFLRNLPRDPIRALASDREIRDRILAEIAKQPWGPRASVDVRVENGVVELHGAITDDRERLALRILAENVPGVKEVRDRLTWVEPLSGFVVPADGPAAVGSDVDPLRLRGVARGSGARALLLRFRRRIECRPADRTPGRRQLAPAFGRAGYAPSPPSAPSPAPSETGRS